MGSARPELLPDVRSLPIESHILFYRVTANRVEIIRVLHHHQDPQRHLK
ncbi:type II toxin-antitoxin system RelE/ParE family toxin [Paraperlucidibaca baekdonensis]